MTLTECKVLLQFEKLQVPTVEVNSCIIDVFYEDKKLRVNYPQENPLSLIISSPFKRERTSMLITLLIQKGKKYRKLAKGELNIYKKYLFNQNLNFEKWIYLSTYSNQLNIPPNSNENNVYPGKIFIKGQFLDSESFNNKINNEDLKNYLTPNNIILNTKLLKGAISSIPKKERESSTGANKHKKVNASLQEGLNKLGTNSLSVKLDEEDEERLVAMKENEYDDDLSDVSLSIIDEDEDDKLNEVDSVNLQVDSMITKLRKYFDENSDSVLPNDHDKLRNLLENLTSQVKSISETYSQNLQSMSSINKRLKFQAKDYYERYKELKTVFEKERKEFQAKNKLIKFEEKINTEENMKIGKEIADIKNEIDFFQKKLGIPQEKKDEETEIMVDILKSLKEKGVDIYEGLSKEQIEFINDVINEDEDKGDSNEDGEKYAKAIEDIANFMFNEGLIQDVKIEEIEVNEYAFNDKKVCLMFDENDELRLTNGVDLKSWILENFKVQPQQHSNSQFSGKNGNSAINHDKKKKAGGVKGHKK